MFGLLETDLKYIISVFQQFNEIEKAVIFGSRAKGNYKSGADVDIAIYGEKITFTTISRIHSILEEKSHMPYFFDVVDYTHLSTKELKEHIDRIGISIYEKHKINE